MNQNPTTIIWRKSTYSGTGNDCVEMGATNGGVAIRNSNHPDDGTLIVPRAALAGLLDCTRSGELDHLAS